mgnify:CR=1 FL=1
MTQKFTDKYGNTFKVDVKNHLVKFLNPTSRGTKYYDVPPDKNITKIQYGRILLQIHQILHLFKSLNVSLINKKFLDIGTGNGMIPKIISLITPIKLAVGIDPFLDKEHKTSWQKHNHLVAQNYILKFIKKNNLDFHKYSKKLEFENFSLVPSKLKVKLNRKQKYQFFKLSAHSANKINHKFDFVYLKSIEHFNNWERMFKILSKKTKKKSLILFKHRSFFSYLGPHRYSTSGIPWGHVLLKDNDYKKYIKKFHKNRSKEMINFFYNGLSYPRISVNELLILAAKNGFKSKLIINEPPRYLKKILNFSNSIKNFWSIVNKNYPKVSSDEIFSGMYHIVLERV